MSQSANEVPGDKTLGRDWFPAPTYLRVKCGLSPVFILVRCDFREACFGNWSRGSLDPFPEDLVIELGWDTIFTGEVEAAGFLRPVLRVMRGLQLGTGGERSEERRVGKECRL